MLQSNSERGLQLSSDDPQKQGPVRCRGTPRPHRSERQPNAVSMSFETRQH